MTKKTRYQHSLCSFSLLLLLSCFTTGTATSSSIKNSYHNDDHHNHNHNHYLRARLQAKAEQYQRRLKKEAISSDDVRRTVLSVKEEALLELPYNASTPDGTLFGGIAGVTYDSHRKLYYVITNDELPYHPPRSNSINSINQIGTSEAGGGDGNSINSINEAGTTVAVGRQEDNNDGDARRRLFALNDLDTTTEEQQERQDNDNAIPSLGVQEDGNNIPSLGGGSTPSPTTASPTPSPTTPAPTPLLHSPRFYTVKVDRGVATIEGVYPLKKKDSGTNDYYSAGEIIPQAIAYKDDRLFVAYDDLDVTNNGGTGIAEFDIYGNFTAEFTIPDYFRFHQGYTSLSINPSNDGHYQLWAATGDGLNDDDVNDIRVTAFDVTTRKSTQQYVYPAKHRRVVGMLNLDDNGGFIMMEQKPVPNSVNYTTTLVYARTFDAINVETVQDLEGIALQTMRTETIATYNTPYKFEGLAAAIDPHHKWDKSSSKSHRQHHHERDLSEWVDTLYIVLFSDNQFIKDDATVALFLEIETEETPLLTPTSETADATGMLSIAADPAIWVHPHDPSNSLILGTLLEGGLVVYDLHGNLLQSISSDATGVDVLYAYQDHDYELIDIAIVTDNQNDKVRIYQIQYDKDHGNYLTDITDGDMPDIGQAQQVAAYTSPYTNKYYAFVVSGGNHIVQLQFMPRLNGEGIHVMGSIIRTLTVPEGTVGGLVVDQELGYLYATIDNSDKYGIIKYDAEPGEKDAADYPKTVVKGDEHYFAGGDLTGITLYYGVRGEGYLVVSVSGDSTFVVLERHEDNKFFDSFVIGNNHAEDIDQTDRTQGIDIVNVYLGSEFKCGVFVAQDNDNEDAAVNGAAQGELFNSNTNFKLVPYKDLAEKLYYVLDVEPDNWGPRKFALTNLIDSLAQDVYRAFAEGRISGRDAEALLFNLNSAASELYKATTKKHQMISVVNPWKYSYSRRLSVEERREETRRRLAEDNGVSEERNLKSKTGGCRRRLGYDYDDAYHYLDAFIDHLEYLENLKRLSEVTDERVFGWIHLTKAIKGHLPY